MRIKSKISSWIKLAILFSAKVFALNFAINVWLVKKN